MKPMRQSGAPSIPSRLDQQPGPSPKSRRGISRGKNALKRLRRQTERRDERGDDRNPREHCERLRDKEYDIRESLAYTPPYSEERERLEYRLREVHDERERYWRR